MKICYIVPWFPSLNAENPESQQGLFDLRNVIKLSERGNKFKVISLKWKGQSEYEKINDNVEVFRIPIYFSLVRYPLPHLHKLIKKIKEVNSEWNPDVLEYAHTSYLTALPAAYLKNKFNMPLIAVTDNIPGVNWSYGNRIVDFVAYVHSKTVEKRTLRAADRIRLLTSNTYATLINLGIHPDKIFVITRGVDDQIFKPIKYKDNLKEELFIGKNEIIVLFVGRIDLVKGVKYLIQAAKKLTPKYKNVRFLIVGDGFLKAKYEEETQKFGNIQFLGFRKDIPDLMNIADIFVLTSLSEGACNVVMEASSSGLPVVATRVGEVPRIINDGETGILIDPKDVEHLVNSLEMLIKNPKLSKQMGISAREHIKNVYAEKIIYDKLEIFYNRFV